MLRMLGIVVLLACGTASAVPIDYTLPADGTVSLAIYDGNGHRVRELLHATVRQKGKQVQQWDELDQDGKPAPAGTYTWRLVSSSGLRAEHLFSIGSSTIRQWPGQYGAPSALAIDAGAIFLAAEQSGLPPQVVKFTLDGKWLWTAPALADKFSVDDIAVDGNMLYVLGHTQVDGADQCSLYVLDATTGKVLRMWPMNQYGMPTRVTVREEMLLVSAPNGQITWINPDDGKPFADMRMPAGSVADLTIIFNGNTLFLSGDHGMRLLWQSRWASEISGGFTSPTRISIDRKTDDIFIAEGGSSQQVKRCNISLNMMQVYGRKGGRSTGAYDPESFHSITDIAGDGKGGFVVVEAGAPFRVAHFDRAGKLLNEWFGGMPPQTRCVPDPENPNLLWLASAPGWLLQAEVDYNKKIWKPHACYHWPDALPAGLIDTGDGLAVHHLLHADLDENGRRETYLWFEGISGALLKVDEQANTLQPVALMSVIDEQYTATLNETLVKSLAPPDRFYRWKINGTVQWTVGKAGEGGIVEVLDTAGMPLVAFEMYRGGPRANVTTDAGQITYLVFDDKELMHEGTEKWGLTTQPQPFSITVSGNNAQLSFSNGMMLSRPLMGGNWQAPASVRLRSIHGGKVALTDLSIDYTYRNTTQTEKVDLADAQWVRAPLEPAVWAEAIRLTGADPVDPVVRAQYRAFTWADANGDHIPQAQEIHLTKGLTADGLCLYLDEKLNLFQRASDRPLYDIYSLNGRTKTGAPIWDWGRSTLGEKLPSGQTQTLWQDAKGNLYQTGVADNTSIIAKFGLDRKLMWQVASEVASATDLPLRVIGEVNDLLCFTGAGSMQIWTNDGLYVGGVTAPGVKGDLPGSSLLKAPGGDVFFFGFGEYGLPVYRLTGFNTLQHQEGQLTINAQ